MTRLVYTALAATRHLDTSVIVRTGTRELIVVITFLLVLFLSFMLKKGESLFDNDMLFLMALLIDKT